MRNMPGEKRSREPGQRGDQGETRMGKTSVHSHPKPSGYTRLGGEAETKRRREGRERKWNQKNNRREVFAYHNLSLDQVVSPVHESLVGL